MDSDDFYFVRYHSPDCNRPRQPDQALNRRNQPSEEGGTPACIRVIHPPVEARSRV